MVAGLKKLFGKMKFFLDSPLEFADSIKKEDALEIVKLYALIALGMSLFLSIAFNSRKIGNGVNPDFLPAVAGNMAILLLFSLPINIVFGYLIHLAARLLNGKAKLEDTIKIFLVHSITVFAIAIIFTAGIAISILVYTGISKGLGVIALIALFAVVILVGALTYFVLRNLVSFIRALSQIHKISTVRCFTAYMMASFALQFIVALIMISIIR